MIRRVLAAVVGGLLASGLVATQLVDKPSIARSRPDSPRSHGPQAAAPDAPAGAAGTTAGSVVSNVAPGATFHTTKRGGEAKPQTLAVARPGMFNVERDRPRVDRRVTEQLAAAKATEILTVYVHAATGPRAADAAQRAGLSVFTTLDKVGVAVATGTPDAVRRVTTAEGVSYVQGNRQFQYLMETSNTTTRSTEARKGFDVTYLEPQPDKPGTSKRVCTTKRVKNKRTGKVRRVRSCRTVTTPPQPQPPVTRTQHSPGVDGSGVTIAVLDTGTDATHPMFQRRDGSSKVVRNLKQVSYSCYPSPGCIQPSRDEFFVDVPDSDTMNIGGHGTHVSGIAAGVDVVTSDGRRLTGVAPGADLVVIGMGQFLDILNPVMTFEWVLRHHRDPCGDGSCPPIRVTNNSYSFGTEFDEEDVLVKLQRALVAEGVVMVWAAGNSAGDGNESTTNGHANDPTPGVLSIASYNDAENGTRTGGLSSFSSRGKRGTPATYPDVAAPGSNITSACRATLTICRGGNTSDLDYGTISGTSMAAPTVAGIVAQLLQANPALTPAEVEDILEDSAHPFPLGAAYEPDPANATTPTSFDKGHGLVDTAAAVARARALRGVPAAPAGCRADDASVLDTAGDAYRVALGGESSTTQPTVDVLETRTSWDPAGAITFTTRLADVAPVAASLSLVDVAFVHGGDELVAHAERIPLGGPAYTLANPDGTTILEVTGRHDAGANEVSVTITNAQLAEAKRNPFAAGDFLQVSAVTSIENLTSDSASATCPYLIGAGSAVPPPYTSFAPAGAVAPLVPADAALSPGGTYEWDAGPYTAAYGLFCETSGLSEDCFRDRVLVLDVPAGGATFDVTVTPEHPAADFDVTVRGPDGTVVASSVAFPILDDPGSVERVSAAVTQPGRYLIQVRAHTAVMTSYRGTATLKA